MASAAYGLVVEGIEQIRDFDQLTPKILTSLSQAINKTLRDSRVIGAKMILGKVDLPSSYLSPSGGRFSVARQASSGNLEGAIVAQGRATSLARYATNLSASTARKRGGVTVQVKPGSARFLRRAFLIPLRRNNPLVDTSGSFGLAVRLKAGETLKSRRLRGKELSKNVYLLYGPSVYQVFENVREELAPIAADELVDEFDRLMALEFKR